MNTILFPFLFFLPAGVANMMPVFAAKIPGIKQYNQSLDLGLTFRGKRIFGDHKTIRGVVCGVVIGTIVAIIEQAIFGSVYSSFIYYSEVALIGFLLSLGALLGDAVKSFFKRQLEIKPGKSWFPFDQTDYIIGGILLSLFIVRFSAMFYIIVFLEYFLLHLLVSFVGYLLGFKESAI